MQFYNEFVVLQIFFVSNPKKAIFFLNKISISGLLSPSTLALSVNTAAFTIYFDFGNWIKFISARFLQQSRNLQVLNSSTSILVSNTLLNALQIKQILAFLRYMQIDIMIKSIFRLKMNQNDFLSGKLGLCLTTIPRPRQSAFVVVMKSHRQGKNNMVAWSWYCSEAQLFKSSIGQEFLMSISVCVMVRGSPRRT